MGVVARFICQIKLAAVKAKTQPWNLVVDLQVDGFIRLNANYLQQMRRMRCNFLQSFKFFFIDGIRQLESSECSSALSSF